MKGKKIIWGIILVIAMLVIAGATCFIVLHFFSDNDSQEYIKPTAASQANMAENHNIDWNKLHEKNKDVYSWIYIPDTKVDYAVVQPPKGESDLYYLDKNLDKEYEFAGSIFSERMNKKDYSDPVTVLYGHNMLNGSMFATLHKFKQPPLITAIVNVILSVLLIYKYGIFGTILATVIARLTTQWYDPYLLYKHIFKESFGKFYVRYWFYIALFVSGALLTNFVAESIAVDNMVLNLVSGSAVCVLLPNCWVLLWTFKTEEFAYVKDMALKIVRGRRNRKR